MFYGTVAMECIKGRSNIFAFADPFYNLNSTRILINQYGGGIDEAIIKRKKR